MNFRILFTIGLICLSAVVTMAQKPAKIVSFTQTTDHISVNDRRNDLNGTPCALVKVQVVDQIVRVEGNKIGEIVNSGVEKWVYMCKGSRNMKIHLKNHLPLQVKFQNFKIRSLESNRVYELVIEIPDSQRAIATPEIVTNKLRMKVIPSYANVTIWGDNFQRQLFRPQDDGTLSIELPYGRYHYTAKAEGYHDYEGSVFVSDENLWENVDMQLITGTIMLSCETKKVDYLIDGQPVAKDSKTTALSIQVAPGRHEITVVRKGHKSQQRIVNVLPKQTVSVHFDELTSNSWVSRNFKKLNVFGGSGEEKRKNNKYTDEASVDYSIVSVEQEHGLNFIKATSDNEQVCMPQVNRDKKGNIEWLSNRIIDVVGDELSYLSFRTGTTNVYVKTVDGRSLARTSIGDVLDFSYSSDGRSLCCSQLGSYENNIYVINVPNPNQETAIMRNGKDYTPVFSNNKQQLFFSRQETTGAGLFIYSYNLQTRLSSIITNGMNPCPLKDEAAILCVRPSADGRNEIWKVNYITHEEKRIVWSATQNFTTPTVSPDGKWILLVGNNTIDTGTFLYQNTDIYVCRSDGSGLRQLTYHAADDLSPVWSQDGKSIYFISQRGSSNGTANVWRMNFNLQ